MLAPITSEWASVNWFQKVLAYGSVKYGQRLRPPTFLCPPISFVSDPTPMEGAFLYGPHNEVVLLCGMWTLRAVGFLIFTT